MVKQGGGGEKEGERERRSGRERERDGERERQKARVGERERYGEAHIHKSSRVVVRCWSRAAETETHNTLTWRRYNLAEARFSGNGIDDVFNVSPEALKLLLRRFKNRTRGFSHLPYREDLSSKLALALTHC